MSPAEQAAADHEAAAVLAQDDAEHRAADWETRARATEKLVTQLQHAAAVLERTALPMLDPQAEPAPDSGEPMPSWALPQAVVQASFDTSTGIAAAREWSERELDAMRERVQA